MSKSSKNDYKMIFVNKTVYGAPGEAMYSERWRDVPDSDSAIAMMKTSQYAYLAATQTMLRQLSRIFQVNIRNII